MSTWATVTLILLSGLASLLVCASYWILLRRTWELQALLELRGKAHEDLVRKLDGIAGLLGTELNVLDRSVSSLRRDVGDLLQQIEEKKRAEGDLFIGSFLPDDAHQADVERVMKQAEDRALQATGPIRYSSRPSNPSDPRSRREPLIRPANPTGNTSSRTSSTTPRNG